MRLNFLDRGFAIYRGPEAMLAIAFAGAGSSIAGGIGGISAANQEANLQKQQGDIALQESQINANNAAYNSTQQVENQRLAFLANGVSLEGSPTAVLAASKSYAQTQVNSILNEGAAKYNLAQEEAAQTKNKGRAALVAGIAQGVSSAAGGAGKAYEAGVFNPGGMSLSGGGDFGNFATNGGKGF